jgi:hypothetical protein
MQTFLKGLTRCVYFIFFRNNKDNNLQVLSGHVVIVLMQAASDTVKILFLSVKRNIIWEVIEDKRRFRKHAHKTKDRVIRTPLKTGGELR